MRDLLHNPLVGMLADETLDNVAAVLIYLQATLDGLHEGGTPGDRMLRGQFLVLACCEEALRYEAQARRAWSRPRETTA
jgi:hypothetical protein